MASVSDNFDNPNHPGADSRWSTPLENNAPDFLGVIPWLNGWPRLSDTTVLIGTGLHCIGCGKCHGIATVEYRGDIPDKEPEWPFKEGFCPICSLEKQVQEFRDKNEDNLATRAIKLKAMASGKNHE